jgi:hypothetical protein
VEFLIVKLVVVNVHRLIMGKYVKINVQVISRVSMVVYLTRQNVHVTAYPNLMGRYVKMQ